MAAFVLYHKACAPSSQRQDILVLAQRWLHLSCCTLFCCSAEVSLLALSTDLLPTPTVCLGVGHPGANTAMYLLPALACTFLAVMHYELMAPVLNFDLTAHPGMASCLVSRTMPRSAFSWMVSAQCWRNFCDADASCPLPALSVCMYITADYTALAQTAVNSTSRGAFYLYYWPSFAVEFDGYVLSVLSVYHKYTLMLQC
jgi:hypothetical protein